MRSTIRYMTTKMTSMSSMIQSSTRPEGDISSVFASLSGDDMNKPLEPRFADLKREIIQDHTKQVKDSWYRLLDALKREISIIRSSSKTVIPQVNFNDMKNLSSDVCNEIRTRGVIVVRDVLPDDYALKLKMDVENYIKQNPHTKAFPQDKPVVYELYWSPAQIHARADSRVLEALTFANSFWHASPSTEISLKENTMYVDRLRIRKPGDAQFALGPHVDGGGIERWEDPEYRSCYTPIFEGHWEKHDSFDATHRVRAQMCLYNTAGGCSAFRSWQGWLSLSTVSPGEGGLLVNPLLKFATPYWLLRPFFTQRRKDDDWQIDTSSIWQGATPGRGQEMNDSLHPHLELSTSMVSIPKVRPGDMVFWHCDTIHAVDTVHRGQSDSSVFYIPAAPLCQVNVEYLTRQRDNFQHGIPPPDFPGGQGESRHVGRANPENVKTVEGRRAMGLQSFEIKPNMTSGEKEIVLKANNILNL
ncbi:unnamed protein product [Rotaria sordida]|uniref:DUF1479-domain-containing protein n=1 Tax=Rotaria sordida TaxID=392033 RepID=A0A818MZL9_9BILA|nr:unnamed protein product [Rotaria sordida]CAF1065247.1 unnamed protein product [Rotaria sordida]CAF1333066.1 unnamed protein product [Rotaria sordida]CAF1562011.1 unnamed protein product [Rotaria sordida]CAF3596935.1 unnamed protein product [Rotaria sordida]